MIRPEKVDAKFFLISIALGAAFLVFDLSLPLGVAGGVPYVALVLVGLWTPGQRYVLGLAAIATALIVLGYFYSPSGGVAWVVLANRALAVFAIWITALLIAHRKQAEVQLRTLACAVEQSPTSVMVTDTAGNIGYVNPKFTAVTGYAPEEVIGRNPRLLKSGHTSPEAYRELWARISSGREWRGELCNKKKNGGLYWESASISPVRDANGRITNFLAVKEDINERKQIELELREAGECLDKQNRKMEETMASLVQARERAEAANRAKSGFLANMSHELRTPLNAVIGCTELMESEVNGPVGHPNYREYLAIVRGAGQHLLALITDILDISRIEAGKLELNETEVPIVRVIEESLLWVEEDAAKNACRLSTRIMNSPPNLYADERKLRQMLVNLLSNAVKFTPAGGEITLRAEVDPDGGFVFSVADTGIGIAAENIQTALGTFGPVETALSRNHDGAGLGLPLTKVLVELHGGTLELDSEIEVGTTVTIRFPAERVLRAQESSSAGGDAPRTDTSEGPRSRGVATATT